MLNKTHLITGSYKIIYSENLAEKTDFGISSIYNLINPMEHYSILVSLTNLA